MSEITSKSSTVNGSSLAPPVSKAGSVTEHDVLFAALFGGVVVAEQTVGQTSDSNDVDAEENLDSSASILMAMQAVTAMLSDKSGKTQNDQENSEEPNFIEGEISAEAAHSDIKDLAEATYEVDETQLLNPAVVGPMIAQGPEYNASLSSQPSNLMARMAFEGEGVPEKRWGTHIAASQMSKNMHLAGKGPLDSESTDEMMDDLKKSQGARPEPIHKVLDKSVISRSHSQQINIPSRTLVTGPTFVGAEASGDGNNHFDSSDEFIQSIAGRFERSVNRQVVDTAVGDTSPTNAARLALSAASAAGGQMSQQNNGQTSGQSGGSVNTGPGISNGSVMEMLDLAQDNWTEMLLQRVEKGLAGGKDRIDFHLNPRNLGKMRISLIVQNERTNVHIQTETNAAAQVLSDAESRLAQMMDASGVKFGSLTSQHNQNFSGQNFGQNSGSKNDKAGATVAKGSDGNESDNAKTSVEPSENLINMQA